jgi:probable rRNA maturation factor
MASLKVEVLKAVPAPIPPAFLREVLAACLRLPEVAARLPAGPAAVAVKLTGDRELRRLNRGFLGEDRPTDVLSFPAMAGPPALAGVGGAEEGTFLGDLAISWPAARRQAEEFGHGAEVEVALLAAHGFLHLLGWDHSEPAEEAEMTRLTLGALASRGLAPSPRRLPTRG